MTTHQPDDLLPGFVCPMAGPVDLIEMMMTRRHQQILQKLPTIQQQIENNFGEARAMIDMMRQRGVNPHLTEEQLFQQIMQHKLNFLGEADRNSRGNNAFRRRQRPQKLNEPKPTDGIEQGKPSEELPYHYSRFEKNLNMYNLEYDVKEKHVRQTHQEKEAKKNAKQN